MNDDRFAFITIRVKKETKDKLEQLAADNDYKKMIGYLRRELEKLTADVKLRTLGECSPDTEFVIPEKESPPSIAVTKRLRATSETKEVRDQDYRNEINPQALA